MGQNYRRRNFIKTLLVGTVVSTVDGTIWNRRLLADVHASSSAESGILHIKISDFPTLENEFGSIRLGLNPLRPASDCPGGIDANGKFAPVIITRGPGNTFYALDSRCSHEDRIVNTYSESLGYFRCPCHNSRYALDGENIRGPDRRPGQILDPLQAYEVSFDGDDLLTIIVPDWAFSVLKTRVLGDTQPQIALEFIARRNVTYEIVFRSTVNDPWEVIPFSTSPGTPPNRISFASTRDDIIEAFVDRDTDLGFYGVSTPATEL